MTNSALKLKQLQQAFAANPAARLHIMLPDRSFVPSHFHVTEVGLVRKDFIDCGGTVRSSAACVIQVWVADDTNHRLDTSKLSRIFELAAPVLGTDDLPVEIEYEQGFVSQFPLTAIELTPAGILLELGSKHTACLAPELCGPVDSRSCCGDSNCG